MGSFLKDYKPIILNGALYSFCAIVKFVVLSAADAELVALFLNMNKGEIFRLILNELDHLQPPTPIHRDNITTEVISNNTVKKHRSRSMEIKYFWGCDQVKIGEFDVFWHPVQDNLGDYTSKHYDIKYHQNVRPLYLHERNSPIYFPRDFKPSDLQGFVGIKYGSYVWGQPLHPILKCIPQAPRAAYVP